VINLLLDV
jgi:6-methylsalicylic acid synthase